MANIFPQERDRGSNLFPSPEDQEVVGQNPPALVWLRHKPNVSYTVVIKNNDNQEILRQSFPENYAILDKTLPTGSYLWNIYSEDQERGWQQFCIPEHAIEFLAPSAADILAKIPNERPRHIFFDSDRESIHERCTESLKALSNTIDIAIDQGLPSAPQHHKEADWHLHYNKGFKVHREYCDRNLVACALGHRLFDKSDPKRAAQSRKHAKDMLMCLCDWNPAGPCSQIGAWGDEFGLSHARCLPAVFDWCYDLLNQQEREYAARTIEQYALQCEERIDTTDFINNPGNSHVGRIPAYLGEAALVLYGTHVSDERCCRWLQKAVDIYASLFPFFGGRDGGWAEGVFYASSYTKWYLPFFLAVEKIHGFSFLDRPFYHKISQFFMHCAPPGWESHPFCDGYWCKPDDEIWPGFMAQNPFRVYAERFGPDLARRFDKKLSVQSHLDLHLLDVFTAEPPRKQSTLTGEVHNTRQFRDAGIVSMHSDIKNPKTDIVVLARASKFGSISHQHADQGSFAIMNGGTCLISPSGYFGPTYGSNHHQQWTNHTQAHNCILIDGQGQATNSHTAIGKILSLDDDGSRATSVLDLSLAYDGVKSYIRRIHFDYTQNIKIITIEDELELTDSKPITFLLHSLSEPQINKGSVSITRNNAHCDIAMENFDGQPHISDECGTDLNDNIPNEYHISMPPQFHMRWDLTAAKTHHIRTRITVTS